MSRSTSWLAAEAKYTIETNAQEKQWDMTIASLSHTPQSKEGAKEHNDRVREITKVIMSPIESLKRKKNANKPVVSSSWVKLEPGERMEDYK